jgi:hypothetical protein
MNKSHAFFKQVCPEKEVFVRNKYLNLLYVVWLGVVVLGSFIGWSVEMTSAKSAKALVSEIGLVTEYKPYTNYFWVIIWCFKFLSMVQVFFQTPDWALYKRSIPGYVLLTLMFFIIYEIMTYINLALQVIRISGHGLILSMGSFFVYMETEINYSYTLSNALRSVGYPLILFNFYTMFWAALAYHTLAESLIGSGLGLFTSYIIYNTLNI